MKFSEYTQKSIKETLVILKSSDQGISSIEAQKRLKVYGLNEIKTKEIKLFDIFLKQFKSPFVYLLLIAAVISFFIQEKVSGIVILVFVFINVMLGFFQESRAFQAVALLKKYFPLRVHVVRKKIQKVINKEFLVPGDIVLLDQGDIIPADLRLITAENFLVEEGVLTGESLPVLKTNKILSKQAKEVFQAKNIVFAGTSVISGKAKGIVINTGKETVFGEITKLVSTTSKESLYEKDLLYFSSLILKVVILTIVAIFLINLILRGRDNVFSFLLFCIALMVAILPETLPLIVTFSFSSGALKLAQEKVVVKRLAAVGDLGNIEILCSDKTGTLTKNKLKLEKVYSLDQEKCLLYGILTSSFPYETTRSIFNPFDAALYEASNFFIRLELRKYKAISEIPFDPNKLRSGAIIRDKTGKELLIVKGAPEVILKLSSHFNEDIEKIKEYIEREGRQGKRVLAIAYKEIDKNKEEKDLIFLGCFSFSDPLKKTAKESIVLAEELKVKVKILTGDSKEVAGKIAKEINLIENENDVILGETIEVLSDKELEEACHQYSVFARVSPQTKYKIVKKLSEKYEVGFLGDGINDAPALQAAHVGLVVHNAVDVAREASDIILLKDDLQVIIQGIKQGRAVFSNINKYIRTTLTSNLGNFYAIALVSLFIPFLPMLPVQILLINLLSDLPLVTIASDTVDEEELKKPKLYQLHKFILLFLILGLTSTIFDFIFFGIFYKLEPSLLRTLWYIMSILTEVVFVFSFRTYRFFAQAKKPSFLLLLSSFLICLVTIALPFTKLGREIFFFTPPSITALFSVFGLIFAYFVSSEIIKLIYLHYWQRKNNIKTTKNSLEVL